MTIYNIKNALEQAFNIKVTSLSLTRDPSSYGFIYPEYIVKVITHFSIEECNYNSLYLSLRDGTFNHLFNNKCKLMYSGLQQTTLDLFQVEFTFSVWCDILELEETIRNSSWNVYQSKFDADVEEILLED